MKNIVMVGFMGTGKTAIAGKLADSMNIPYVSIDDIIEEREKRSINDIFRSSGEKYFRQVEKEIVKELSAGNSKVIDAGGGVVLDSDNLEALKKKSIVICLWATPEAIYDRVRKHSHRPLLNVDDPEGKIRELLDARRPYYEKADFHVDTTDKTLDEVFEAVRDIIKENM